LNFAGDFAMLNFGMLKIFQLNFLTLKNKVKIICEFELNSEAKIPDRLFQYINIQCLEFNGFLFSKSDGTDLLTFGQKNMQKQHGIASKTVSLQKRNVMDIIRYPLLSRQI
jgi:hypothetical protein